MTTSLTPSSNSNFSSSLSRPADSDLPDLLQLARKEKLVCSQLQHTFKRLKRGVALGAVLIMFQGSSAALSSAWADGCVDNPTYCVVSTADTLIVNEGEHTLRSAVATANGSGASSSTIGFADQLFGIVRDQATGDVISSTANYQAPVVIALDSTLEIRTNLAIKAPTDALGSNILTIERGTSVAAGNPLISVNTPSSQNGPLTNGATAQVQIENVTLNSNANLNTGNLNDPKATAGVTIQVNQTEVTTENGSTLVTPEVVLKSTQVLNAVSESGGAAVNTSGDVRVENSTLVGNMAVSSSDGTPSDGGAIKAEGTVTVVSSALNGNSATGNGGAIAAGGSVVVDTSQIVGNMSDGNGGAISSAGTVNITSTDDQVRPALDDVGTNGNRTDISGNMAAGSGGAISAGSSVDISNTNLISNQSGAAIDGQNVVATISGGDGGAIHTSANVTVTNTVIGFNSSTGGSGEGRADGQGGGIAAAGEVLVQGSVISGNSSEGDGGGISANTVIVAPTQIRSEISNNYADGNGGAIAATQSVQIVSTVQAETQLNTRLSENISYSSGGAIASGGAVSVYKAEITGNTAANDGGAIQSASTVTIQGSTLSQNVAGGERVEIGIQPSAVGGNGGAIASAGEVTIIESTFASNRANSGWDTNAAGDGGAIYSQTNINVSDQSSFELNSAGGNGGAIAAVNISVADSTFNGNFAVLKGGAISGSGTVTTSQSVFGTITVENPDYNPLIRSEPNPQYSPLAVIENPDYNPLVEVMNPNFNPSMEVINPNFNISVNPTISNPNYKVDVPQVIPNPACPAGSRIYDGEDFGQGPLYICEFQIDNGDGTISFGNLPSKVINPLYDERTDLPNPLYDDRPTITVLTNPDEVEDTRETLLMLQRPELPENNSQFIPNPDHALPEIIETYLHPGEPRDDRATLVLSNSAGEVGGSIYALDSVLIQSSQFIAALADNYGGAIDIDDESLSISRIIDSTFTSNKASFSGAVDGHMGHLSIENSTFLENQAYDGDAGAIWHMGRLTITDSSFRGNLADGNGGAISLDQGGETPYLEIARSSFVANSATNGNGGAIALREQENGDHLSAILSSSFEENYSSGLGSAIYGSLALFFNNFDGNNSESGSTIYVPVDGLTAAPLARFSSTFIGNKLNGDLGLFQLCDLSGDYPNISEFNLATDQTCFGESNSNFSTNPDQINQIYANFVPNSFVTTLLNQIEALDLESNYVFKFIQDEIAFDSEMTFRSASSDWSAGDLQRSIDQTPDQNTPDQNTPQSNNNLVTSVSAVDRILILKAEEERMAAEKIAAQEAAAKLAAAKKAKKDAAALRSAERKAKLAALLAKLAATKARGIELKKKSSWINLMKNVSKSTTAKKLVKRSNN